MGQFNELPEEDQKKILEELYNKRKLSAKDIGEQLGLSSTRVLTRLQDHGITTRNHTVGRPTARESPLWNVTDLEWKTLGVSGVAKKYNLYYQQVHNFFTRVLKKEMKPNATRPRDRTPVASDGRGRQERFDDMSQEYTFQVPAPVSKGLDSLDNGGNPDEAIRGGESGGPNEKVSS